MRSWHLQDAKSKLSELIDRAQTEGPQVITRHGVAVGVVMPDADYQQLTAPRQRLGDFSLSSPLRKTGLVIARDQRTGLRTIDR